jgi:hypothetical protein
MCIEHILNLVWHGVKKHRRIKAEGWREEEVNPMHEARGPRRRQISGVDRLESDQKLNDQTDDMFRG